jgi:crotonobetainyl-CoA:carnitine CoA-transferase CaiB-like acyl-CoA transferase
MVESCAVRAQREVMQAVGLEEGVGGTVTIDGGDFPRLGTLRLGSANAGAMAAHAEGVAQWWRLRGGERQSMRVHTGRAVQSLRSFLSMRQNGYLFKVNAYNAVSGWHRTADDRWVCISAYEEHFVYPVLEVLQVPCTVAAVDAGIARWKAVDFEDAMAERRVPCAMVRSESEWAEHPQGKWLAKRPVVEVEKLAPSPPEPPKPAGVGMRPLSGLRVLEFTHQLCGPMTGRLLAEHGSDNLRVTSPRRPPGNGAEMLAYDTGWGKRTAIADFSIAEDVARLQELLRGADVLVHSHRPGALERHGLSVTDAVRLRPGIIYVSVSCFGDGGPWRERGGYDPIAQSASGVCHIETYQGKPRQGRTQTINDYLTAYHAAAGIMAALIRRAREGGSYHVKVSLTRSSMWLLSLGLIPGTERHAHLPFENPVPPLFTTRATPFGMVTSLSPAMEYSATPAYWDRPPEPPGASQLVWLPRD